MIEMWPTPTATASTHSSRIVVSACTVQTLHSSFIKNWLLPLVTTKVKNVCCLALLYFSIFCRHIVPTLCASHRSVTTKGSSLSNRAVIFCSQSACLPWWSYFHCLFSTIMKHRMVLLLFPHCKKCVLLQLYTWPPWPPAPPRSV